MFNNFDLESCYSYTIKILLHHICIKASRILWSLILTFSFIINTVSNKKHAHNNILLSISLYMITEQWCGPCRDKDLFQRNQVILGQITNNLNLLVKSVELTFNKELTQTCKLLPKTQTYSGPPLAISHSLLTLT